MVSFLPEFLPGPPASAALVQAYLADEPTALTRFGGSSRDPAFYREQAARVDERFDRAAREQAARCIDAPHPVGERRLRRVVEEGGFFVTTGQQPGLFTGPLYSVYKALTAIRLADALEVLLERPVAPLFWVASEDHDWPEVDHTYAIDVENVLQRVGLEAIPGGDEGRPLFRCPLEGDVVGILDRFLEVLPRSDFVAADAALLRAAYAPGRTMGEAFATTLGALLGHHGLLFTDAAHPALKEASLPLLLDEAAAGGPGEDLLERVAKEMDTAGLAVQVPVLEGGVNLFLEGPQGRERLYRDGDGFRLRHSGLHLSMDELTERVRRDPAVLSPNVLMRPVVESALFPVLSYVAGPGEMAYWGQLREFFAHHGLSMPVVHPRSGAVVVESKVRKVLDRFSLEPVDFHRPVHEVAGAALRDEIPGGVKQALGEYRGAVARAAGKLAEAVREVDPTLKGPVEAARNQAYMALDDVERKVVQALKRRNEITLEQLEKAALHLYPGGKAQERVLNVFYYTARYGRGFLDALLQEFSPPVAEAPLPLPPAVG